jgi:hypothetical protein
MPKHLETVAAEALQLTAQQRADLPERLLASIATPLPILPRSESRCGPASATPKPSAAACLSQASFY